MALMREVDPDMRLANIGEIAPFRRPEDVARYADGLRQAGYQSDRDPPAYCGPSFRLHRGWCRQKLQRQHGSGVVARHASEPLDLAMSRIRRAHASNRTFKHCFFVLLEPFL